MLLWGVVQEGRGLASGGGQGGVHAGRGRGGGGSRPGGGRGAGGVAVAQEAGRGSGVGVLLVEGGVSVLGVGRGVVQVRAGADGGLSRQQQAGLHERLRVDVRLGQPAQRHTERGGGVRDWLLSRVRNRNSL